MEASSRRARSRQAAEPPPEQAQRGRDRRNRGGRAFVEHQPAQASPLTRDILARKVVHVVVGCALGALAFAPRWIGVPLVLVLAAYKFVAEFVRLRRAEHRGDPFLGGGSMFREHERRFASGAFFLVVGVAIVIDRDRS